MMSKLLTELRAFCETTSVRGIPRVIKAKTKVTFVVWLLAVLICAAMLVWQLSVVFTRYFQFPINTLLVQAPAWQYPTFPDITLCNLEAVEYNVNFNVTLKPDFLSTLNQFFYPYYDELVLSEKTKNHSSDHMTQLLSDADAFAGQGSTLLNQFPLSEESFAFSEEESLLVDCLYFDWAGNTYSTSCLATVHAAWDPTYYKCFTLRLKELDQEQIRGISMILYIKNFADWVYVDATPSLTRSEAYGVRALVHAAGTAPDMSLGMSLGPGTETSVLLSQTKRTRLAHPYSNCTDQEQLTDDDTSDAYTLRYCVNICVQQKIVDQCGCVSSSVPQYSMAQLRKTNFSVCGNVSQALNFFVTFFCANDMISDPSVADNCNNECVLPCDEINYVAIPSTAPWPQNAALYMFRMRYIMNNPRFEDIVPWPGDNSTKAEMDAFWNALENLMQYSFFQLNIKFGDVSFNVLKDVAAFSVDAMGAQIGGVLSLWLGVTVMFLFETFEFLYVYLASLRKRESTLVRRISVAPSTEVVPTCEVGKSDKVLSLGRNDIDSLFLKLDSLEQSLIELRSDIVNAKACGTRCESES